MNTDCRKYRDKTEPEKSVENVLGKTFYTMSAIIKASMTFQSVKVSFLYSEAKVLPVILLIIQKIITLVVDMSSVNNSVILNLYCLGTPT